MSLVTVVWSMIAAACLTLAAVHLPVWWRNRDARATLSFSIAAICTAGIACCELLMLKAQTPTAYATALRWVHVPILLLLVALAGFAYHYLDAGWRGLAVAGIGLRLVSLVANFTVGQNLNFLEIKELRVVPLFGDEVAYPVGVTNPWVAIGQAGVFLLMIFFAHAGIVAWRRGRRAAAFFVGGTLTLLMLLGGGLAVLQFWFAQVMPSTVSLFTLGIVLVMGYALSVDLLRARELVRELSEREQEATLSADAASLGTFSRDATHDIIRASRKWRELFRFTPDEPLSMEAVMQRIHVDDRGGFGDRLAQAARKGGDYQVEFRLPLPDGRTRWIAAMGRVEFDASGRPLRSRGACIDITARKQAEQEMLHLRQDIAHVGRVSVMGQLASALAHEINQPLGAILRNAEAAILFMQDPSPDLVEIKAILEDIRKDDQRAGDVIDRMRALLKRQAVEMRPIDVGQMLGDVATLLRPDAAARHIALAFDTPAGLPPVRGDRVQLQQVLINLILNAMDAIDGAAGPSRIVSVVARPQSAQAVEIVVADTGPGIAPGQLEHVFDPFFTTKQKGMGMGLSISRSIIEAHSGVLWAESPAEGGARFRFTVPNTA